MHPFLVWSVGYLTPLTLCWVVLFLVWSEKTFWVTFSTIFMEISWDMMFVIDTLSGVFIFVVSVVSLAVFLFSVNYMQEEILRKKFMILMVLFVTSMYFLVCSVDLFWVMVGWDGLGLTSFGLIIFFQNWKSFNSAMVTFMLNRLGDSLILISLVWFSCFSTKSFLSSEETIFSVFLVMGGMSKSAQIPFSTWLPLAMAAPTPVSALVHSSTLVVGGVYLLIRFNLFLSVNDKMIVCVISFLTILMAGLSSLGEYDLKKIIALSTLSHVGLMMMFISISAYSAVMVHFHAHAMFKSLLFMIAGDLIHMNGNNQDIRRIFIPFHDYPLSVSLIVSLLSMVGFPFMAGFVSKELLLSFSSSQESVFLMMFFLAIILTASYSFRIFLSLFSKKNNPSISLGLNSSWLIFFLMTLFTLSSGSLVLFLVKLQEPCKESLSPTLPYFKSSVVLLLSLGGLLGSKMCKFQGKFPNYLLGGLKEMWWVSSLCFFFQKKFFSMSWFLFYKADTKGLLDFLFFESNKFLKKLSLISFPFFLTHIISWVGTSMMLLVLIFIFL